MIRCQAAAILALMCLLVAGCSREPNRSSVISPRDDIRIIVAASIAPLADYCRQVGGDRVRVEQLVPAGASPHTYELTPAQMRMLSRASVLVVIGLGLEFWADKAADACQNSRLVLVDTSKGLNVIRGVDGHGEASHGDSIGNPHTWLSPKNAVRIVTSIRDTLCRVDSANASYYSSNACEYMAKLDALDGEIRADVESFKSRDFVAFHSAYAYLARDYGLRQTGVIEESPGREPSPAHMRALVDRIRRIKAKAIFAEPQFPTKPADVIASETGIQVSILDPLGREGESYIDLMRANLSTMSKAMR